MAAFLHVQGVVRLCGKFWLCTTQLPSGDTAPLLESVQVFKDPLDAPKLKCVFFTIVHSTALHSAASATLSSALQLAW